MAKQKNPVVVDLAHARHALWLAEQFGRNASRQQILARFLAETREGFHRHQPRPRLEPGARA